MENLMRCPKCFRSPEMKVDSTSATERFIFSCELHGHMAIGDTLEKAKTNWNTYVTLLRRVA